MVNYSIVLARSARKELESLPISFQERIFKKIKTLAINPRSLGAIKLQGETNLWRVRVGDYRVIYEILENSKTIDIIIIRHRKDVYRF